jgi:hypothetical protein
VHTGSGVEQFAKIIDYSRLYSPWYIVIVVYCNNIEKFVFAGVIDFN